MSYLGLFVFFGADFSRFRSDFQVFSMISCVFEELSLLTERGSLQQERLELWQGPKRLACERTGEVRRWSGTRSSSSVAWFRCRQMKNKVKQ